MVNQSREFWHQYCNIYYITFSFLNYRSRYTKSQAMGRGKNRLGCCWARCSRGPFISLSMVRRFYHSQQYTLNKDKNQVSGTSALRYSCFYLRQQPKIWKSAESNIDSDKNARHFTRQRKIKKQWNTHPLLPLESPYLFPFFLANTLYVLFL